ncbi:MAG: SurA N-terminal domain-containing protein [Archangium sp.]|nr:SurA N-terminal domain-containing protein [Archangium sp.]
MRILISLLLLTAPLVHAQAVLVDRIVATVDNRAITRSELDARAERSKSSRDAALDELINEYLIAKDAISKSITISDEEVDKAIQMVMDQNKISKEEFQQALVAQGYTLEGYRTSIGLQLLEFRWLAIRTSAMEKPSDEAARAKFFADQKKRFVTELRTKASITSADKSAGAVEVRP